MTERQQSYTAGPPNSVTIRLPWPPQELWPNRQKHWRVRNDARQEARIEGAMAAHGMTISGKYLKSIIAIFPPSGRRYDEDNLKAALKGYQDGICQALGVDDSRIVSSTIEKHKPARPGGEVVYTLISTDWLPVEIEKYLGIGS